MNVETLWLIIGFGGQGLFFARFDLAQYGMNVTTLMVPLFALSAVARRCRMRSKIAPSRRRNSMAKLSDFVAGAKLPDLALPDHTGQEVRLSELTAGRDPLAVVFYRGWY